MSLKHTVSAISQVVGGPGAMCDAGRAQQLLVVAQQLQQQSQLSCSTAARPRQKGLSAQGHQNGVSAWQPQQLPNAELPPAGSDLAP